MHWLLLYDVADDYLERRVPFRDAHLARARAAHERGDLVMAGALAEPADGALLVFRSESARTAEEFARDDPYVANGVVKSWRVRQWTVVIGGDAAPA